MRAYGANEDFSPTLQQLMAHYSGHDVSLGTERIQQVAGEIEEVRQVMCENIEAVLERGEKIELLVDKTENLNHQAFRFRGATRSLRRQMWLQNLKVMLCVAFAVGIGALFIAMLSCGMDFHKCQHHHPPPPPPPPPPPSPPHSPSS
jgi:vesicle-associated membrane protein 7